MNSTTDGEQQDTQRMTTDRERLEKIHHLMKELWRIRIDKFNLKNHRFGLSVLLDVVPGGSTVSLLLKLQYIHLARRYNLRRSDMYRLYKLLFFDWLLGIPSILGSILTWKYNADEKIFHMLRAHMDESVI